MRLPEKHGGCEILPFFIGFPSRPLPFSSKSFIPAFTGKRIQPGPKSYTAWQVANFGAAFGSGEPVGENPCTSQEGPKTGKGVPTSRGWGLRWRTLEPAAPQGAVQGAVQTAVAKSVQGAVQGAVHGAVQGGV